MAGKRKRKEDELAVAVLTLTVVLGWNREDAEIHERYCYCSSSEIVAIPTFWFCVYCVSGCRLAPTGTTCQATGELPRRYRNKVVGKGEYKHEHL